ncbi:MAG: tetratricopeptide repeat protein [Armatimonadetes bacterium]|nr:tetratricopeptide repeat protein [Armatimonadota bacterium]
MADVQHDAQAAYLAGDYARSVGLFRDAIKETPHSVQAWQGLGYALYAAKQFNESVDAFRECLLLSGGSADGHFGMAMALCATGDEVGAAKELEATVALKPDHAAAKKGLVATLVRAGKRLQSEGKLSAAEELLQKAYKIDHKNSDVIHALVAYLRHVNMHNDAGEIVRQAMQDVPHMPGIHDLAAEFGLTKQRERGWLY